MKKLLVAAAVAGACASSALAQTSPNWSFQHVPTTAEWNNAFAKKQDALGYTPVNRSGDTMVGPLRTTASTSLAAGFNIPLGVQPLQPNNGDIWLQVGGIYYYNNGIAIGPLISASAAAFAATAPIGVAFPSNVITYALAYDTAFTVTAGKLALASIAASDLLANCTGAPAEPAACSLGSTLSFSAGALQTGAGTGDATWAANSFVTTVGHVNGVAYPAAPPLDTVAVVTSTTGGGAVTYQAVPNAALANSAIEIGSTVMALGSTTGTIAGTVAFSGTLNASGTFQIGGTALALPVSLANGGTGAALTAVNGGIIYSNASTMAVLAAPASSGQCLLSSSTTAFAWGACSGGASVSSVANSDGTLTISPTTGAVVASLALGHANTWTAAQSFGSGNLKLNGATSGTITLNAAATAGTNTITLPAVTDTVATLGTSDQVLSGGSIVVSLSQATGNITVDCGARPLQYITGSTAAWTITAPANDGSCILFLTNAASTPVAPTFSGFTVGANTGAVIDTTASHKFSIAIWRVNGVAGYNVFAHQ